MKIVVLGAGGMLGHMVLDVLAREKDLQAVATARAEAGAAKAAYPEVSWRALDAEAATDGELAAVLRGAGYAVNCIGLIKQRMDETKAADVERAIRVNALFPQRLGRAAADAGVRVLQIATDCVYSGARGSYRESDPHDALDVYGKTKSLGECRASSMSHLRSSIVGPELGEGPSLLSWFLSRPRGESLKGFVDHRWNGVTTLHFARLCAGVVRAGLKPGALRHVVPADAVTKHELLDLFARAYGRGDLSIAASRSGAAVDRTLATDDSRANAELWKAAGYDAPPTISRMVEELAQYKTLVAKAVNA
ncbi:MAG: sugar nucleotide-binding protein [Elusimicrobia bacterium]|nr:sugar nucleotide-binding protein [Elusimicrobiota bacterium]